MGMVGLIKRDFLEYPDVGFATLPEYYQQGVAYFGCRELLDIAKKRYKLSIVTAFTKNDNVASMSTLRKLGFIEGSDFEHPDSGESLKLFQLNLI